MNQRLHSVRLHKLFSDAIILYLVQACPLLNLGLQGMNGKNVSEQSKGLNLKMILNLIETGI